MGQLIFCRGANAFLTYKSLEHGLVRPAVIASIPANIGKQFEFNTRANAVLCTLAYIKVWRSPLITAVAIAGLR